MIYDCGTAYFLSGECVVILPLFTTGLDTAVTRARSNEAVCDLVNWVTSLTQLLRLVSAAPGLSLFLNLPTGAPSVGNSTVTCFFLV